MAGKFHFYFGIAVVIVFLLTGQYMDRVYDHLRDMEPMNRALFRAGHLYILLFGLINAALGIQFRRSEHRVFKMLQGLASFIIVLATVLVIYAFFAELPSERMERPVTRLSLYAVLFGVAMHGLVFMAEGRVKKEGE